MARWQDAPEVEAAPPAKVPAWQSAPEVPATQAATAPQQPETWGEFGRGLANAVTQGVTFGFGDELKGALHGGIAKAMGEDYQPTYEQVRDEAREEHKKFAERHPYVATAGELGGGASTALVGGAIPAVSRGLQLAGRMFPAAPAWLQWGARSAVPAAIGGGVQGFGEGEGGLGDRAASAAKGAGFGAVAGPALTGAVQGATNLAGGVGRAIGLGDAGTLADNLMLRNLKRDNLSPADVSGRINAPEYAGAPMIIPDAAGRNTVNLGSSVANMPGRGMDAAEKVVDLRRAGGPGRMQQTSRETFGGGFGDARDPRLTLEMERGTNAPPLYEQSYQEGIPATALPRAAEFMADPIGQEAIQRGLRTIELEHLARGEPFAPELYGVRRATPQESGNAPQPYSRPAGMSPSPAAVEGGADPSNPVQVAGRWAIPENSTPNMRLLDATKQGYDEIVNDLRNPRTGIVQSDRYIRAVDDSRRAFRDHLAEANPTYGEALQAWSGPSSSRDALRRGQEAFGKSTNDIVATNTGGLDPADAPFYRLGAGDNFGSKFTDPRNVSGNARRFREDIGIQGKLADILPGDAHERLNSGLEREMRIGRVNAAINPNANSQTGRLAAAAEDIGAGGGVAAEAMQGLAKGGIVPGLTRAYSAIMERSKGLRPDVGEALADRLFTTDPGNIQATIERLARNEQTRALSEQLRREMAQRLMVTTGQSAARLGLGLSGP